MKLLFWIYLTSEDRRATHFFIIMWSFVHLLLFLTLIIPENVVSFPYYALSSLKKKFEIKVKMSPGRPRTTTTSLNNGNWLGDLWNEVIEFSTYGPGERKLLKERREQEKAQKEEKEGALLLSEKGSNYNDCANDDDNLLSIESFQQEVSKRLQQKKQSFVSNSDNNKNNAVVELPENDSSSSSSSDELSLELLQSTIASYQEKKEGKKTIDAQADFDGYALRDLLMKKWGVPLDIAFQRQSVGGQGVYCTILPVRFGSKRCRHLTELGYLMHLQGVIEILRKYDNLVLFLDFIESTDKRPMASVESVPFRLDLNKDDLNKILWSRK